MFEGERREGKHTPKLLVDKIVAHRLPKNGMADAGKEFLTRLGEIDRLDMWAEATKLSLASSSHLIATSENAMTRQSRLKYSCAR